MGESNKLPTSSGWLDFWTINTYVSWRLDRRLTERFFLLIFIMKFREISPSHLDVHANIFMYMYIYIDENIYVTAPPKPISSWNLHSAARQTFG